MRTGWVIAATGLVLFVAVPPTAEAGAKLSELPGLGSFAGRYCRQQPTLSGKVTPDELTVWTDAVHTGPGDPHRWGPYNLHDPAQRAEAKKLTDGTTKIQRVRACWTG